MAEPEVRKYKVLESNRVTLRGEDLEKDAVIDLPISAGEHLVKEDLVKAVEVEPDKPGPGDDDSKKTEEELKAEYKKLYKALDKHNRDPLYEAAKDIIEIGYDINKEPLIEAIIEAEKTKVVLEKLEK